MQQKNSDTEAEIVLRGMVDRIRYQNPNNGYTVFNLKVTGTPQPYTVVGVSPGLISGAHVIVRGIQSAHQKYGSQISAASISEAAPSTPAGIERLLSSGMVKGIGERTAEILVNEFGDQTLVKIVEQPELLAKLPGVGKKKAERLHQAFLSKHSMQEVLQFLVENGISTNLASKIYNRYGNRAVEILKSDPYLLSRDLKGIGFLKADAIALNLGFAPESPQRIKAALYYAMEKSCDDGHCYLSAEQLQNQTTRLTGQLEGSAFELLEQGLAGLIEENYLIKDSDRIYLKPIYQAENFVAQFLIDRATAPSDLNISTAILEEAVKESAQALNLEYNPEQERSLHAAIDKKFMVITGGPGCGKTTIIRGLTKLFSLAGKRLALTAPTGRAAQRMAQVCGYPASTIHRLLRYDSFTGNFYHGASNPMEIDVVIVDESSMIDIVLARSLMSAIPRNATLILVGDKDQLPSVGPGKVFQDIVSMSGFEIVLLNRLYRRSEVSDITEIAHSINSGSIPSIPEPDGITKTDAYLIEKKSEEDALTLIESLYSKQLSEKFGFSREEISILTPTNRGELGTESLNKRIQQAVNPNINDQQLILGNFCLRVGDRVCQRVNNYQIDDLGVFNGDPGVVTDLDPINRRATVALWDGRIINYEGSNLQQLSLAYAVTVHRAQGSEIPCVILVLHDSHFKMLERQLIYTGITRAKKLLVIVGNRKALRMATQRAHSLKRQTSLVEKIDKGGI